MTKSKAAPEAKFFKGHAVRVHPGRSTSPNYVWRRLTPTEQKAWYDSDASKGLDDAGESKLCPRDVSMKPADMLFKVVRARCSAPRGWGNPLKGCAELEDENGTRWYAHREDLY